MSAAEILFNASEFALLPGQETFVKSKVLLSVMGGGAAGGRRKWGGGSHLWAAREASGKSVGLFWCGPRVPVEEAQPGSQALGVVRQL